MLHNLYLLVLGILGAVITIFTFDARYTRLGFIFVTVWSLAYLIRRKVTKDRGSRSTRTGDAQSTNQAALSN